MAVNNARGEQITRYDPFDPAVIDDPFPYYAWLRDEHPVYHNEDLDIWVVSRYDDVAWALRTHDVFSSTGGPGFDYRPVPMLTHKDPPDHTRLRRLVQKDFTPRMIAGWAEHIRPLVRDYVGDLCDAGTGDFAEIVAYRLPQRVIADMLGMPDDRRDDFKRWADEIMVALSGTTDPEARTRAETTALECAQYFYELVVARQEAGVPPADERRDVIDLLLQTTHEGDRLDNYELVSFITLLMVGGIETTTNLLGSLFDALADSPEQWQLLRDDPSLIEPAIEEALRYQAPIQLFFRNTLAPIERHGVTIPAHVKVEVPYGSGNRDPRHYDEPDRFDVTRFAGRTPDHLSFGAGVHYCLGAPLARLEVRIVLEEMLERIGSFGHAGPIERPRNPLLRGVAHLPLTVTTA